MTQATSGIQQITETMSADMPIDAQQGEQPAVTAFSEATLEGAAQDAKMKFVTSLIERHLSGSKLDFSHLHEVMTPMTNSSMPKKGVMIAVTPKDPNMSNEDVVASMQDTLGQVPIIQDQFNGLSSNAPDITGQIIEAAQAGDTDKVKQLLVDYKAMSSYESGHKFGIDFPVGNNTAYHLRLDGISVDDLMQSLLQTTQVPQEQAAIPQDTQEVVALSAPQGRDPLLAGTTSTSNTLTDKAAAAQAVNTDQAAAQQNMQLGGKWAARMPQKDISPEGITAEQVVAAAASQVNGR